MTLKNKCKAVWFHPCNEVSNNHQFAFGNLLKKLGKINGVPDYVFLWKDGSAGMEFKAPKGKLNESQQLFKEWCIDRNVNYFQVFTAEEAIHYLKEIRVIE